MGVTSSGSRISRAKSYQVVSPDDAALALRGLRTLAVRLERETASALAIAEWLATREEVAHVLSPMLPGAPGHELWKRDFAGGCGLFSFVLKGGTPADRARLISMINIRVAAIVRAIKDERVS